MSKPAGISLTLEADGPAFRVRVPTVVEDKIWEAVEEAISRGWTVEQFRREAAAAWTGDLERRARDAAKEWDKR